MPAISPLTTAVVALFDHKYVYGVVPPEALAAADPLLCPQVALVAEVVTEGAPEDVNEMEVMALQLFAEVTVIE